MPEIGPSDAGRAFLYVSGEMDAAEAAAFERRLGEDQALREALCQAVELMQTLEGLALPAPRPAYRQHVRRRLRSRGGLWHGLTQRRTYRGHPALWSAVGAAAALLVVLVVPPSLLPVANRGSGIVNRESKSLDSSRSTIHEARSTIRDVPAKPATIEMAEMWASMHNHDHLARAQNEENRRRSRLSGPLTVRH